MSADLIRDGYAVLPSLLSSAEVSALRGEFDRLSANGSARGGAAYGIRGVLRQSDLVRDLASDTRLTSLVEQATGAAPRAVRSIFFDKSPEANWPLPWHQDRTVALQHKAETTGFTNWTLKQDVPHAEPPVKVLHSMATIRLHLDDTDAENGALQVVPHWQDRVRDAAALAALRHATDVVTCTVRAGGAVLMRPLTPHASERSRSDRRRRVLHLEYCGASLPAPLQWAEAA
ncbi:phytanoyl-CoA dioxygenase family protein [Halovulum sp. GXIMD14793]